VTTLFADGRVIDVILALVVIEAVAVIAYWRRTGRGIAAGRLLPNLLAGAFLLLALRAALDAAGGAWIALWLAAALAAHATDLATRWRR